MANPSNIVDLDQSQAEFLAEHAPLLAQHVNRSPAIVPADSRDRVTAEWMNLLDDFILAAVERFGSIDAAITALENATGATVVRDIDYTAEGDASLSDGDHTIGGITHTVINAAGASVLSTVAGTGIRLRYKDTGAGSLVMNGSTQTAPGYYTELQNLIPSHREAHRYLMMWHYTVAGSWDSSDGAIWYPYIPTTTPYVGTFYEGVSTLTRGGSRIHSTNTATNPAYGVMNGSTQGATRTEIASNAGGVNVYNVMALKHVSASCVQVLAGIYDDGWPDIEDLVLIGETEPNNDINGGYGQMNLAVTRMFVGLMGPGGVADPHGIDIHRARVYDLGA